MGGHTLRGLPFAACAIALAAVMTGCEALGQHQLSVSPDSPAAGEDLGFSARIATFPDEQSAQQGGTRLNVDPERVTFLWDLDGDGKFDAQTLTELTDGSAAFKGSDFSTSLLFSYAEPQTVEVTSLVNLEPASQGIFGNLFGDGDWSVKTETLTVTDEPGEPPPGDDPPPPANQPPLASFSAEPNPAEPEEPILFDASASSDPDGSIARYEWDLDQSPGYERDTGTTPTTSRFFNAVGTYTVGLRVTDDAGMTGTTTREIIVRHDPEPRRVARRAARLSRFELRPDGRAVNDGVYTLNGDELIFSRAKAKGTLAAKPFPKRLRGTHDVRWAADYVMTADAETGRGQGEAFVLLTFATGGRACLGATVSGIGTDDPEGRFRVIGAIGKAARLHALGTMTGDDRRPVLVGRGRFRLGEKADFGLGKSRCGKLRRLAPRRD